MKKLIKRTVSGIIAFGMMLTILPVSVLAVDDGNEILSEWLLSSAYYDDSEQCFVLTEDYTEWDAGSIWYNTPCKSDFTLELDYYTGSSDRELGGADGIAVAFYADHNYIMGKGEELGFNGSKGYGIELDTYYNYNRDDPNYNHIALIQESVGNHLVTEQLPESEDEQWHHLKVAVENGLCSAYIDETLKISHEVETTGYGWIGITASTGTGENLHAVKNIVVSADNDDNEIDSKYLDLQLSHQKLSDADGYYSYEITATIKNTAEATAKNMILLFASESSLTLAEDSQEVISIGDLPSGAEKTVSWQVTAPWPEESGSAIYSVIADIDNQTATLLKENYIYLVSKNENDNSFVFGIDQWNFSNNFTYFTEYKIVDGEAVWDEDYYLSDTDYSILQSNLSNIEREIVDAYKNRHWNGSCYGMSATAVLAKMNVIDTHFLQALGTENLYEISKHNDDEVESFINFYHLQQKTIAASSDKAEFSLKSTTEQLQIIEDKAEAVLKGGCPFILSFSGDDGGHAVVAYGVEHKDGGIFDWWGWKSGYDSRILIYDCNNPEGPIYLYYNTGTDEWYMPKYNRADNPDTPIHATKLTRALDDLRIIDSVNYDTETQNHYARLLFESQADGYFLKQDDKTIKIDGTTDLREEGIITLYDENITADGVAAPQTLNLVLPSLTESYTVEPIGGESCQFDMIYENEMLTASIDDAKSIHFSPDGSISAMGTTGEFQLSICSNEGSYDLPWFLVSINGQNSDEISLKKVDDGILVSGSNLNNIIVTSEDTDGNIQKTSFSAQGEEAIIQANQKENLVVKEDLNNDGEYDTVISDQENGGTEDINVTDVSLTLNSVYLTHIGETCQLEAIVTPDDATDKTVIWTSSDPSVAAVSDNGLVTAVSGGSAVITVTTVDGGYTATCTVTVNKSAPIEYTITFDPNGGNVSYTSAATSGGKLSALPFATRDGYTSTGWYTAEGYLVTTDTVFTANTTLYAGWRFNETYIPVISTPARPSEPVEPEVEWTRMDGETVLYIGGKLVTGWYQDEDGNWYWFALDTGAMAVDKWVEIDGVWYLFGEDGRMLTGWQKVDGKWYYLKPWGGMAVGWQLIDGVWYYLRSDGSMAANAWVQSSSKWYYLTGSGAMAANRWVEWKGEWYYLYSSGAMATNATIDGYYVNASGVWVQ